MRQNPYHGSPTPRMTDSLVLGGKRHKEAKSAMLSCINDLHSRISSGLQDNDSRLVTIIQDVGSGKTHLTLHIKGLADLSNTSVISYTDLSQISPRTVQSLYNAILAGFNEEDILDLRKAILYFLKQEAERNVKGAKKIFRYGIIDSFFGRSIDYRAQQILENRISPDYSAADQLLKHELSTIENNIAKSILHHRLRDDVYNVETLEDVLASLSAIAILNLKFLKKLTIFQIDEFDCDKISLDVIKAIINSHLPSSIITLNLTPSAYEDIRSVSTSVFDRLEKANYKIDLAGSNTFEEVNDIILEYIRYHDVGSQFSKEDEKDLTSKIKVIYDEFPDFRNVRSMINIFYHATEAAQKRNCAIIDEKAIDDTIKHVYPGLKIRGSIMSIPLSEFIRIKKDCNDIKELENDVRDAVRNLVNCAHDVGSVSELSSESTMREGGDIVYSDSSGSRVAVSVIMSKDHIKNFEQIANTVKTSSIVDKLLILTNSYANGMGNGATVVNIDRSKMIDLIYFNGKYEKDDIFEEDQKRALMLARSIKLC
ncbi:MAG: hypothetical protein WCA39_03985 [Nitrososphaeraceae archaeon]